MKKGLLTLAGLTCGVLSTDLIADQMHYRNIITGERAQGLGGAYVGVSDDASGVYYNPAGLSFAQSNDISGSANAFYSKKLTYKKAIFGTDDWKEESGGTFAPFFGTMQKLDKILPGLVGGFAYYTTDTELKDQDSLIVGKGSIGRFHRAANQRAATWSAAGALGYRVSPTLGVGLGLGYIKVDELTQVSQNLYTSSLNAFTMMSVRESLVAHGAQASLGLMWAPASKISMGLSAKSGAYASQKLKQTTDQLKVGSKVEYLPSEVNSSNPLGSLPLEIRAGVAWFVSPRLLVTTDLDWHDKADDMDNSTKAIYKRESVLNYSVGTEYYVTPSVPVRVGFFTNSDATPTPKSSKLNQADHVDYTGMTIFGALAQPTSQLSAGAVIQQGKGKSQKLYNDPSTQDIEAFAYTLGFSATHSF